MKTYIEKENIRFFFNQHDRQVTLHADMKSNKKKMHILYISFFVLFEILLINVRWLSCHPQKHVLIFSLASFVIFGIFYHGVIYTILEHKTSHLETKPLTSHMMCAGVTVCNMVFQIIACVWLAKLDYYLYIISTHLILFIIISVLKSILGIKK
jgi:hypothetical protein